METPGAWPFIFALITFDCLQEQLLEVIARQGALHRVEFEFHYRSVEDPLSQVPVAQHSNC